MNKDQGIHLLDTTFNAPFDEQRFIHFTRELLNDIDTGKSFDYGASPVKKTFVEHINKFRRLGSYEDPEGNSVDVLTVQLKNDWALERSRTMLRNFTADYLKNRDEKDAALVAYYTTNPDDWRFSYIRMDYTLEQAESGKIKVREKLTPARRYSYLVGKNEPNHTAQSQLLDILVDDDNNPSLSELESAFSVDAVSKQFYLEYRNLYERLKEELDEILKLDEKIAQVFESQTIETSNFAKKLMGQIVFLYFLQKKGWLGIGKDENGNFKQWGSGPKNFLQRLFNKKFCDYQNFFNDVLEPLFYEALATERPNDIFSLFNCRIPFLSGGLFEPLNDYNWEETDILIDNDIFSDIFKTFNQYNFTVREDEPLEKEVAIDPEMLGKVFENLLSENIRKGKGTYYTPRTIVHYMCQESLINYLDSACEVVPNNDIETLIREGDIILELETAIVEEGEKYESVLMDSIKDNAQDLDDALTNIKVCDPAIGSGAFSVGMLNEIVKTRKVLELYLEKEETTYSLKRHSIQESIYGVDIDPGAIDIAKLRLWLSLIVDENDYNRIDTLPNLDYKIMQGNSLIEEFHGISLEIEKKSEQVDVFSGGSFLDALIEDLHQKQADFFNAEHPNDKKKKRGAVETAIFNIFHNELEKKKGVSPQESKEIETDLMEMTHGNKVRNFFPWKLYFADVFRDKGGFDVVIANPPYVPITKISLDNRKLFNDRYKSAVGRFNLFYFFLELTENIAKSNGASNFIVPDRLLLNTQAIGLRNWLLSDNQIIEIVSFDEVVFEAVVDSILISFINKDSDSITVMAKNKVTPKTLQLSENIIIPVEYFTSSPSMQFDLAYDEATFKLVKKIQNKSIQLENLTETKDGVIQGAVDDLLFINVPQDSKSKPLLMGKDINRYSLSFNNNWINYKPAEMMTIEKKRVGSGKGPGLRMRKPEIFEREKILSRQTADRVIATLDSEHYYYSNTLHGTTVTDTSFDVKYVLGLLNCNVLNWFYKATTAESGKVFAQVKIALLRKLPIYDTNTQQQKPIINLVDKILTTKKANPQADTTALETEIDQRVYDLYELTEEEIAIVEESVG